MEVEQAALEQIMNISQLPILAGHTDDIDLLCGNTASLDFQSGIRYRCNTCFAVVVSIGMPRECKELYDMEDVVKKLKGKI